jgi:hypothetical protein
MKIFSIIFLMLALNIAGRAQSPHSGTNNKSDSFLPLYAHAVPESANPVKFQTVIVQPLLSNLAPAYASNKREKAREALPQLLRAVFNTRWDKLDVLLTVDAGWRNDSLAIEYKYYKGKNLLSLDDNLLVEKIYFTIKPEEIDELETESDEFLFLYLRNQRRIANVRKLATRPPDGRDEESWKSSCGFPVRAENLPMIIQYLKDLRAAE